MIQNYAGKWCVFPKIIFPPPVTSDGKEKRILNATHPLDVLFLFQVILIPKRCLERVKKDLGNVKSEKV